MAFEQWIFGSHIAAQRFLLFISYLMMVCGIITCISLLTGFKASYGRYSKESRFAKYCLPARWAWFLQEVPSLVIPVFLLLTAEQKTYFSMNMIVVLLFIVHYIHRVLLYPFLIRGGKPTPVHLCILAFIFCTFNGLLQGLWHLRFAVYPDKWFFNIRIWCGLLLFSVGMLINIHSDGVLRKLRTPGENNYKIPRGGLFEYVSGANYFGECLEWIGFAVFALSIPAMAFAIFTVCNIGPRAIHHHRFVLNVFEEQLS